MLTRIGLLVVCLAISALAGCGSPAVTQCRIDAVRALPEDETLISVADVVQVVRKLSACKASLDGGAPP